MESLIARIQKLLALSERGGTEAEAEIAMAKVHELLAKHNLSIDDIPDSIQSEEHYQMTDAANAVLRQPWQDWIWSAIARLYFCKHLKRVSFHGRRTASEQHLLVGRPSNIAAVKYIATYIIRTGNESARSAASTLDSKRAFINSFRKGFAQRIIHRVNEQIRNATEGGITDSSTGKAIVLTSLYDNARSAIEAFLLSEGVDPHKDKSRVAGPTNYEGLRAGMKAAETVSLTNTGIGQSPVAAIPHFSGSASS